MRTSNAGIALIKGHEGLRLDAYPDAGYGWARATIGYGHTSQAGPPNVTRGMRITEAEATEILRRDLARFEGYVNSSVHVPLTQPQFDALVSFTFNLGPGNLRESTLLRKLNALDYKGAADEFLRWNKSNGKTLRGLTKRREAERALFMSQDATADVTRPPPKPTPPPTPASPPAGPVGWIIAIIGAAVAALIAFGD